MTDKAALKYDKLAFFLANSFFSIEKDEVLKLSIRTLAWLLEHRLVIK